MLLDIPSFKALRYGMVSDPRRPPESCLSEKGNLT